MYSFVAKEIDYANYFQTVRVQKGDTTYNLFANVGMELRAPWLNML